MNTAQAKTSVGMAITMMVSLASGVSAASTEVMHHAYADPGAKVRPASEQGSKSSIGLRDQIRRAIRSARNVARLAEYECSRLSELPDGAEADADAYSGLVASLRAQEQQVKAMIERVGQIEAEELGIAELRRQTAKARSATVAAERLARQTVLTPEVAEGRSSGEALRALADRFEIEASRRFS